MGIVCIDSIADGDNTRMEKGGILFVETRNRRVFSGYHRVSTTQSTSSASDRSVGICKC